jgi:SpoVK/Ycf46/Vps4 family AAA+-type ATPase
MPSGILLAGPPGTGKTFLVSTTAYEAGVAAVKLNAGRLLGEYVGTSERNLEKALTCIRSLAPVIVMIDEIEQQFQRGSADGTGVERRIFGRILEEMSGSSGSKRGEVIWFAATNRIDLVDSALKRPGRFDRIVPILPPSDQERWDILQTKFHAQFDTTQQQAFLQATKSYTGADLEGVLIKATELAWDKGLKQIDANILLEALSWIRPSSSEKEVERMILASLEYCNDLSLVAPNWRKMAKPATPDV